MQPCTCLAFLNTNMRHMQTCCCNIHRVLFAAGKSAQ